jgi:hypothetical protein
MNKMHLLPFCAASFFVAFPVMADPLVVIPAGRVACSVELTPSKLGDGSKDEQGQRFKHIDVVRDGNFQRDIVTGSSGAPGEVWRALDVHLLVAGKVSDGNTSFNIYPLGSCFADDFTPRILNLDIASFSWIAPSSFVAKESKEGKETFHYRAPVSIPGKLPVDPPRQVFYDAWIEVKSLLPIALDDSEYHYVLTFSPTPALALVLPDRFKKRLLYYERANAMARPL